MQEDTNNKIEELSSRIDEQSNLIKKQDEKILELEEKPVMLDRYLDNQSKDILATVIEERIMDLVWNKYFYYFSTFESVDSWDVISDAVSQITSSGLLLETLATIDDRSNASKYVKFQNVMSFDEESRFRTLFYLDVNTTAADIDYSMSIGLGIPTPLQKNYGFRLEDNILYGICSDGTTESKVAILTTNAAQGGGSEAFVYLIEARFYPGNKVDFYISGSGDATLVHKGTLTTNLPTGANGSINFDLYTRAATTKKAFIDFCEYIQIRPTR